MDKFIRVPAGPQRCRRLLHRKQNAPGHQGDLGQRVLPVCIYFTSIVVTLRAGSVTMYEVLFTDSEPALTGATGCEPETWLAAEVAVI